MNRSYYSEKFTDFITEDNDLILAQLIKNHQFSTISQQQRNAWIKQIEILKVKLKGIDFDKILFEYTIPRMGKRVDNVLFYKGVVYLLEFKIDAKNYPSIDLKQVEGYALDLKNFQQGSKDLIIVPILVSTKAPDFENTIIAYHDRVIKPLKANAETLSDVILQASKEFDEQPIDIISWENSLYKPTPTVIEAAQALYNNHSVDEITRKDSEIITFSATTNSVDAIIEDAKKNHKKNIIFVTGIPGSGKTLVGLNTAIKYQNYDKNEHAVYLSGTAPIIEVLREGLARNVVSREDLQITKTKAKKDASTFFQHLRHFRKEAIESDKYPTEKIVVFDEAQRMWSKQRTSKEIKNKLRIEDYGKSEPDILLGYMDRNENWSVIICLIGGGQEINKGENGAIEWLKSVKEKFPHWNVYLSKEIREKQYLGNMTVDEMLDKVQHKFVENLHLRTSVRSFRSENVSKFFNALLDRDIQTAFEIHKSLIKYPIKITRDLDIAKKWIKDQARGTDRYGIFASSKSQRLRPEGITAKKPMDFQTEAWYLDTDEFVDSSNFMEIPATEFLCQGLEVDWAIVGWDASLRPSKEGWTCYNFSRKDWKKIINADDQRYLINSFRVVLTRARQGMAIFVPKGDIEDHTRAPRYYDGIYEYLKEIGLEEIKN